MKTLILSCILNFYLTSCGEAFTCAPKRWSIRTVSNVATESLGTQLYFFFDKKFQGGGSGKDNLDEQWEAQQEILRRRRLPAAEREKYFTELEDRRQQASRKQQEMWGWQTKQYKKGEDPIDEWKKRRASGQISDLDNQYGDPKKVGGIPLPMASFGVGGEFGVGGKFDNGGRFDLRLPYADQGYVDEDADVFKNLFGNKKSISPKSDQGVKGNNVNLKKNPTSGKTSGNDVTAASKVDQKGIIWPWSKK